LTIDSTEKAVTNLRTFYGGCMRVFLLVLVTYLFSFIVYSSDRVYDCEIRELYLVSGEGRLVKGYENVDKSFEKTDKNFSVSKDTGVLIGNKLENSHSSSITVLDDGEISEEFKVISVFPSGTVQFFQVYEHFEGDHKPFSLVENNHHRTGVCK